MYRPRRWGLLECPNKEIELDSNLENPGEFPEIFGLIVLCSWGIYILRQTGKKWGRALDFWTLKLIPDFLCGLGKERL
ncbi:MAG: hypothetical protein ONB05_11245, partial [candidate division KSB1 bacterium]|nr:hypothetical protein [candidate division KSB1 bacterium]